MTGATATPLVSADAMQPPSPPPATIFASAAEMRTRERHFPRLCRSCSAPMAVQEDNCWHCGASWDPAGEIAVANVRPQPTGAP
jgi:hypothetical protein